MLDQKKGPILNLSQSAEKREIEKQLQDPNFNYDDVLDEGIVDDLDMVEREVNNSS